MKPVAIESRFDFSGGVRYAATLDTIANNELARCYNARVATDGTVRRRPGINKLHVSAIGAGNPVLGLTEWVTVTGEVQLVAISNAKLYWSNNEGSSWTEVTPGSGNLSTNVVTDFAPMMIGAIPTLFIASGSDLFTWDATTLAKIDLLNGIPNTNALVRVYNNRLFVTNSGEPNVLYWSKLGDGTDFDVGGLSDGGFAAISADSDEPIIGMEVCGSSLLLAMPGSIARFTGTADDIEILTDTAGVTNTVGPVYNEVSGLVKPHCSAFQACDSGVMMWTDRGPYAVTEGGVVPLGDKINVQDVGANNLQWRDRTIPAYVVFHRSRMETWFIFRSQADSAAKSAYIFSHRKRCWSGPFLFPASVTSVAQAIIAGVPTIIAGCSDGFVRQLDDLAVNRDDNSTDFTHEIWPAPFIFDAAGPHNTKSLRSVFLQVQRPNLTHEPVVKISTDGATAVAATLVSETGAADTPTNMRYDTNQQGKRFTLQISGQTGAGTSADELAIIGCIVRGSVMERW